MATGTLHTVAPDLHLIEGHHPHNLWDDPDLPTTAVFRSGPRLYLLDTGVGPEQRDAILELAKRSAAEEPIEELVLLNSHGHLDHLGNNDVIGEIPAKKASHYIPRAARPALRFESFFGAMYKRGLPYFDYLEGLALPPDAVASLLRALGADSGLTGADVARLGAEIARLGLVPAIGGFVPSLVVDILLQTYPPVFPSIDTMTDYEELGEATAIRLGGTDWTGWTFSNAAGEPDVHVLQSAGHSAGGVVFFVPRHRFLMLADETSSVPIWADSDPRNAIATARKALTMIDGGDIELLCAGHRPMLPLRGEDAQAALHQVIASGTSFSAAVENAFRPHPEGLTIDRLYDVLVRESEPGSTIAVLVSLQFPTFSTFLKLTLLNHCLLLGFPERTGEDGRRVFSLPPEPPRA